MTDVYLDPAAGIDERVADLLGRMTLEEKVPQLGAVWVTSLVTDDRFDPDVAADRLGDGIGQVTRIGASTGLRARATRSGSSSTARSRSTTDRRSWRRPRR